jgi:hypothetical protein
MTRWLISLLALLSGVVLSSVVSGSPPRSAVYSNNRENEVTLTRLSPPVYPRLALLARIAGDVELIVRVRSDGTVESAEVLAGPPMLRQPALESAQHSEYACGRCDRVTSYRLVYTFQAVPPPGCESPEDIHRNDQPKDPYPRIIQAENHISLIDRPTDSCGENIAAVKVRSLECLYLWRCGSRLVTPD